MLGQLLWADQSAFYADLWLEKYIERLITDWQHNKLTSEQTSSQTDGQTITKNHQSLKKEDAPNLVRQAILSRKKEILL